VGAGAFPSYGPDCGATMPLVFEHVLQFELPE
jgi:hypothetical protein